MVAGDNWQRLPQDPQIGAQLADQTRVADLRLVTRTNHMPPGLPRPALPLSDLPRLSDIIPGLRPAGGPHRATAPHPADRGWQADGIPPLGAGALRGLLAARPACLIRVKGLVPAPDAAEREVHCVGATTDIKPAALAG